MSPRTRSHRATEAQNGLAILTGGIPNATGLPSLPDEIHLEIVSHMPAIPIPTVSSKIDIVGARERHVTLHALSQTCRSLRRVFLRYLWQRIEVYDGMKIKSGFLTNRSGGQRPGYNTNPVSNRKHVEELIRQLEIVTVRDPSLAQHVK